MPSGFPPVRKSLGQHFLTDRKILERIADAARIAPTDTVVEIGPGRGALTDLLVERAGKLVAIEYDRALAAQLRERYANRKGVEIVQADVLNVRLADVAGETFKLIGNVPYYITTPIIFHALERPRPELAVYLVQREVGERIVARAGEDDYGALSANVQAVAEAELLFKVPAGAFQPPPKVESAVIRVTPRSAPVVSPEEEPGYRALVQGAFGMRRKQVQRVLRALWSIDAEKAQRILAATGIDPTVRPETIDPEGFARLLRARDTA
jgi:16S rRNA (adenine1518-N6/adenine1519-N6)-dimethyltransferase